MRLKIFNMNEKGNILGSLGLLTIDQYKFKKFLGGGSALSALYTSGEKQVVFKFLLAPRNEVELERFKLEYSVLERNKMNWFEGIEQIEPRPNLFAGPIESYPLPKICSPLVHEYNNEVNYFGYNYEEGVLLSELDISDYSTKEKTKLLHRIASALNYFNRCGYSHRDLHPENILLLDNPVMPGSEWQPNNPKIKILDLGNCQKVKLDYEDIFKIDRELNEELVYQDNNKRLLSSFTSMPPDFLAEGGNTKNYDSWSFGVFAYSILFNEMPFSVNTINDVTLLRESRNFSINFESNLSSLGIGYKAILKHLLSPNGEHRPSIDAIVRLFSWLVHRPGELDDLKFANTVIHDGGFDPNHDPRDDY